MVICSVPECESAVKQCGLCGKHYLRLWRHGSTDDPRPSAEQRFWANVERDGPTECWIWTGGRNAAGYGRFKVNGKKVFTHRYVYELLVAPLPSEFPHLDHFGCDNPPCCNPAHLRPATVKENTLRGSGPTALNSRKTHCPHGHPYSEANLYVKPNGDRVCRTCKNNQQRARRAAPATS